MSEASTVELRTPQPCATCGDPLMAGDEAYLVEEPKGTYTFYCSEECLHDSAD